MSTSDYAYGKKDTLKVYLTFQITGNLYDTMIQRYAIAFTNNNIDKAKKDFIPHITITEFHVNKNFETTLRKFLKENSKYFQTEFEKRFKNILKQNLDISFISSFGRYNSYGDFLAKEYEKSNVLVDKWITKFRMIIYEKFESMFNKLIGDVNMLEGKESGNKKYKHFRNSENVSVYAIPEYYFGLGKIEPHLSIIKTNDSLSFQDAKNIFHTNAYGTGLNIDRIRIPEDGSFKLSYRKSNGEKNVDNIRKRKITVYTCNIGNGIYEEPYFYEDII